MCVIKDLDDGTGNVVRVLEVDGYYAPTCDLVMDYQEEEFRTIPEWKGREGDVIICAYPKSGTHWIWEVASMLQNGSADRVNLIKETAMLEVNRQKSYDNIPSPRVLNSHIPFHMLPKDVLKLRTKIVFILRNPKDVCVSFYNHHFKLLDYKFHGKFDDYVGRFMRGLVDYGSWFDYTQQWEQVLRDHPGHPIHVMSYEDMKNDNIKEITKLSKFLGVKEDKELIESIADRCDFSRMKKEKDPLENVDEWRGGEPGMYRKGQVGDWKNWFTVAQNERFDSYYAQRMSGSMFTFRYS